MRRIETRLDKLEKQASPKEDWCEVVAGDEPDTILLRTWRRGVLVREDVVKGLSIDDI